MSRPVQVVITGSESVGKSTLAERLAAHYGVEPVPEYVREYVRAKEAPLDFRDHGPIAKGQMALQDAAIARAVARWHPLIVQDTDLISTVVYCDHYFGECPQWIADAARDRTADLYLLLLPDVPWVADGIRDRGERREEMHAMFETRIRALRRPYVTIGGTWDERFTRAIEAITPLLEPRP